MRRRARRRTSRLHRRRQRRRHRGRHRGRHRRRQRVRHRGRRNGLCQLWRWLLWSLYHRSRHGRRDGSGSWPGSGSGSRLKAWRRICGRLRRRGFQRRPAGRMIPGLRCDMPDTHQVLRAADSLHSLRRRPGVLHHRHRRWRCLFLDNWWGLDSSIGLLAFVTLVIALCHELLGLCAQASTVTIHQQPPLGLVDRMPLGADIRATSNANLAHRLHDLR